MLNNVVSFIRNNHENWETILSSAPYFIKVKRDGDYVLLKYDQRESDFSSQLVRECRGLILNEKENYRPVSLAFTKFFNFSEEYVAEIDWTSATVQEKVDGSLIQVWHHGEWHVSTSGTIDAYKANAGDSGVTFGQLFDEITGKYDLLPYLCKDYCYAFELVSPQSRVLLSYEKPELYFLTSRDMRTLKESPLSQEQRQDLIKLGVKFPAKYPLTSLNDCVNAAKALKLQGEGFVVTDRFYNRIKIKSPDKKGIGQLL